MILLIYPPVAKPCEPPPGVARLSGALGWHNVRHEVIDANLEGLLYLLDRPVSAPDTWTRRAAAHIRENLSAVRHPQTYENIDRYKRTVADINRVLHRQDGFEKIQVGLANYTDANLSPVRSRDLLRASETPAANPFYPYFSRRLSGLLQKFVPETVGFSLNYLSQALCTFAMIGFLRQVCPPLKVVLGGGLVTTWMRNAGWHNPFGGLVDEMVAGAGEKALLETAGAGAAGQFYTPDYACFDAKRYLAPGKILPYSASSGCYWNRCAFCPEKAEGNPYCPVPAERVMADLSGLIRKTRPALVHILDNAVRPDLMKKFADRPPGVPWYGFARISEHLADAAFCRALKRSGCVMLKIGLESGDQEVLDHMQKGICLDLASAVLKCLKQAGIATYVYLLFGTVHETLASARRTLAYTVAHSREIDFLNLAVFNLPAYGPDVDKLATQAFYAGDLSLYRQFVHPRGWHRNLVRQFLDREFKRHPAIAAILRNDPPVFTSNHAPFFKNG